VRVPVNEFVYLYRRPQRPHRTPQQMQEWMQRYQAWFKDLEDRGHLVHFGQPLEPKTGRVVKDKTGSFSDGPYAETKDIVMGFSIIKAEDLDQAVAVAKTCPIFDEGGTIEIRPILKL
jgi:hypothetical protein